MKKKITIAIDGFSSTGKSTLAKQLAKKLQYVYVDSGAMYRAVTFYAMQQNIISENHFDKEKLIDSLNDINLTFKYNPLLGFAEIYLNNVNVENEIRSLKVSNLVSKVAELSQVRRKLVEQQQQMGLNKGVVMDGRDIGTVVFPNAELKLFMTASAQKRAKTEKAEIQWADETGVRNDCQHGRSYAPKGKTPTKKSMSKRISLNMISSITNQGKIQFMIYSENMNSLKFIEFLEQLIKNSAQKIFYASP